jgi:hypothetical protein
MVTDKYVESDEDCDLPKDKDDCEDDSIKCWQKWWWPTGRWCECSKWFWL